MYRKFLIGAMAAGMVLALGAAASAAEKIKVATEASFPPFSKTEADGTYTGFELDLGNEVCKRAGLECEWVKQDFDGMIAALLAKKFDMIFSSMSIKPEREEVADFSIPYLTSKFVFYGKKGVVKNFDSDLKGKKVGVYAGATQDQYVRKYYDGVLEPVGYENADQIHADLVNGRIDLAFGEQLPAKDFMAKPEGADFEVVGPVIEDPAVLGKGVGAMFRKGDPLKAKVDEAIKQVYADGTFDKLMERWVPGADIRADKIWQ
ncbi:MAG: transporter substrate-binding domain-containing protein [Pseudomonadota bacterium]|nr:transporter substrate-binding domain-containing protein [Pseudomonadota bacterium]